ncbi:Dimethyladenosine transferase 1, mitochondrial [Bagarius yarrelli]|uniref:Dimethyladenosine transferase 1, mitochondrial n=1 Tax=Bagarius yarrelli TaxID=175774 RepID=A0A556VAK4_BAGYA|nr:Dimethyladenosine transferase 1, mitochondrial [Bagarius yarrelli]
MKITSRRFADDLQTRLRRLPFINTPSTASSAAGVIAVKSFGTLYLIALILRYRMLFPETQRLGMTEKLLRRADVDPTLRPIHVSISQFRALVDAYSGFCRENPTLFSYDFREELRQKRRGFRHTQRR